MNQNFRHLQFGVLVLFLLCIVLTGCTTEASSTPVSEPEDSPQPAATTALAAATHTPDSFTHARNRMVNEQIEARGVSDPAVLAAMRATPRHEYVLDRYLSQAYADHPLPIDYGQTISQPYIVALMTEMLGVQAGARVLEIGTGSGYQAAVLAEMDLDVYTIEIIPELAEQAKERLASYPNVQTLNADGYFGWEEFAPFDAIIVTAAPDHLPQPLVAQLTDGGRLVIPIGPIGAVQTLWSFEKDGDEVLASNYGAVRFVPLTGEH